MAVSTDRVVLMRNSNHKRWMVGYC